MGRLLGHLVPRDERDPAFRSEIDRLSVQGLRVVALVGFGKGIAPAALPFLFEPAFRSEGGRVTTSNWGLFVSRGIVTEHGGHIEIESEEGKGTTARVRLPSKVSGTGSLPASSAARRDREGALPSPG